MPCICGGALEVVGCDDDREGGPPLYRGCVALFSSNDISSSGCISFIDIPELDSGFLMVGAPAMTGLGLGGAEEVAVLAEE